VTSEVLVSKDQLIIADWRQQALQNEVYLYEGVMADWYKEEPIAVMAVAKVDGQIVGAACQLSKLKSYWWTNDLNFGVCVKREHRRQGLGKVLYIKVLENADEPVVVDGNSQQLKKWGLTPLNLVV